MMPRFTPLAEQFAKMKWLPRFSVAFETIIFDEKL